jgi:hypothetical protein
MQTEDARTHFLPDAACDPCMTQCHFGLLAQFIEWCCREKMTDSHVIIQVSAVNPLKILLPISLAICVTTWKILKVV